MFLRSAINHNGIPFEVKRLTPNAVTKAALDEYEEGVHVIFCDIFKNIRVI